MSNERTDKAVKIPLDDNCGLLINVGRDGVWMHFSSSAGVHASMNIDVMAERDGVVGKALRAWCDDLRDKANEITEAKNI